MIPRWSSLRTTVTMVLGLGLASPALAQQTRWPPEESQLVDRLVAIVNNESVTLFELQRAIAPQVAQVMRGISNPMEREAQLKKLVAQALDGLVDDILVYAEAKKMNLTTPPERIEAHIQKIRESNGWTEEEFAENLAHLGFASIADYRRHTEREMLKSQVVGIKVASRVRIDETEVEAEFARQIGTNREIEERRAAHILLRLPEDASPDQEAKALARLNEAKAKIESGQTSFGEMARTLSEDGTRNAGGDLGWFVRGDFHPAFENIAFELDTNTVSEPFRTPFGLHLVTVFETRQRSLSSEADAETIKGQIRYVLREKALEKVYRQWLKSLRTDAFVQLRDIGLDG